MPKNQWLESFEQTMDVNTFKSRSSCIEIAFQLRRNHITVTVKTRRDYAVIVSRGIKVEELFMLGTINVCLVSIKVAKVTSIMQIYT